MRCSLPLLLIAVSSLVVQAQVVLDEANTQATLVQNRTVVSLAVVNARSETFDATVRLEWLNPSDVVLSSTQQRITVTPGSSRIRVALPIPANSEADARLFRLQYDLIPGPRNYGAFPSCTGILNLVNIAPYAFSLQVLGTPEARPGLPFELHVMALHPLTGQPAAGVLVHAGDASATTDQQGVAALRPKLAADYDGDEISVSGMLGDFGQTVAISGVEIARGNIRIEVDKPLYQPGQALHIRTLAFGADGHALAGTEQRVRVLDANGDVAHSASVTSSRFGIGWNDWDIPSNAKAGKYTIEVASDAFGAPFDREVEIRVYELPSFRVSAKPSATYYVAGQQATADVKADYLFGKPVASGRVRIVREGYPNPAWTGDLDSAGFARAALPLGQVTIPERENFVDAHYTAFVTDLATNRTEQRAFDIRLSREKLHVYMVRREGTVNGERFYLTTYLPDGTPTQAVVHASTGVQCTTNRFGVCELEVPPADVTFYAVTASGERSNSLEESPDEPAALFLETDRALHQKSSPVRCHLTARDKSANVFLLAWNMRQEIVFSRMVTLANGRADVEILYDQRFSDHLFLMAAEMGKDQTTTTEVLFPGAKPLQITITPAKRTYRPGEIAHFDVHASSAAALGVAVVDQSVFERARTETVATPGAVTSESSLNSVGGLSQEDLLRLEPRKITDELQVVARALVVPPHPLAEAESWKQAIRSAFANPQGQALASIKEQLDAFLRQTLEYPRNEQTFYQVMRPLARRTDPWGQPYYPSFRTEGGETVLCVNSAGPDKQKNSDDDFCALEVQRPWFAVYGTLIRKALAQTPDLPVSKGEFERQVQSAGLLFSALRDPWGHALSVAIAYQGLNRRIQITSAGPDGRWNSADDVDVDSFSGGYFSRTEELLRKILDGVKPHPTSSKEVMAALDAAGFRFIALRDPWNHPLSLRVHVKEHFEDKITFYTYAEYRLPPEQREKITPVKMRLSSIEIRSAGPDGVWDSSDDFTLATFNYLLDNGGPLAFGVAGALAARGFNRR